MVDSPVQLALLQMANPRSGRLPGADGLAADGQAPHGGLLGAVGVAADGQAPHGRLPGAVGVAAGGQ